MWIPDVDSESLPDTLYTQIVNGLSFGKNNNKNVIFRNFVDLFEHFDMVHGSNKIMITNETLRH